MAFTGEEIHEFKIEAQELLENAELSLLAVDKGTDFAAHYDSIFRAFHSIKGAAGMMEMTQMQEHMHRLETTLTERKHEAKLQKPYIDLFLRGVDACRTLLQGGHVDFDYGIHAGAAALPDVTSHAARLPPASAAQPQAAKNGTAVLELVSQAIPVPQSPKKTGVKNLGRILVVDDEGDLVEVFLDGFIRAGYEARGCTNPLEALRLVESFAPDVLVSDISMPEMTGLELMEKVKQNQPDLPVIFVSGFMDKRNLMEAIRLGVFSVIEKPFEMSRVLTTCRNAVRHHQVVKLLGSSINLLMYQFSDLDQFLRAQGKDDVRKLIHEQMNSLIEQRRELREINKPTPAKAT